MAEVKATPTKVMQKSPDAQGVQIKPPLQSQPVFKKIISLGKGESHMGFNSFPPNF